MFLMLLVKNSFEAIVKMKYLKPYTIKKNSILEMKKILLAISIFLSAEQSFSQQWPAITQTAKPWTRWWWQGSAVNKADLSASMKQYREAGLGGLEITPIYGVKGYEKQFINYLSPQWVEMLMHTLQEGKRLGLGIDMATGTGWPFGGPWISETDACKFIVSKTYTVNGGETLKELVEYYQEGFVRTANGIPRAIDNISYPLELNNDMQSLALDQVRFAGKLPMITLMAYDENGKVENLTRKVSNGKLDWTAPAGKWKLYALFQGLHGKMVERAAPGGEGNVIDHFTVTALEQYLTKFDKAFAGKDISYLRSFFNDSYEVDDARGQANWTPKFFTYFEEKRGYDLRNELQALLENSAGEKHTRVLYDYRLTISELLLEQFTEPWQAWAKRKGKIIRNQSHGSPANILDLYAAIDIPETEGTDILRFKFATSAANVMGKKLASAEAATWLNEHFQSSLGDVKVALDKYFVGGVNHIFYHGTNYSPQNETWPGWLFYAAVHFHPNNPFWKDFGKLNSYVAKTQSFLQSGKPDNDVLLYFPFADRNNEGGQNLLQRNDGKEMLFHFDGMEGFEKTNFNAAGEEMLKEGYAFDLISDKQVWGLKTVGGKLEAPGGKYQTILLADVKSIPLKTWQQLIWLAQNGATIIAYKNLPAGVPGFGGQKAGEAIFNQLKSSLQFKADGNVQKAIVGNGAFLLGYDLNALLSAAKIRKEHFAEKGLLFVRRQYPGGNYYFISNPGKETVKNWIGLESKAASAFLFDAMTEKSGLAKSKPTATGIEVFVDLLPGESIIVQTSNNKLAGAAFPYINTSGDAQPISGEWKLSFVSGGPSLPAATTVKELGSWTSLGDDAKIFSGTAQYSIRFKKPSNKSATAWLLDLGKVDESAEVWLNGKKLATVIGPQFRVVVPAASLLPDNQLDIKVSNGMANRIADLDKRGVKWKKFYNTNFPSRLAQNKGGDGIFTAAKWEPKASGLTGPVTLTPITLGK